MSTTDQLITVKVIPGAKVARLVTETSLEGEVSYRVYVTEPPEDGRANRAVLKRLADHFGVRLGALTIVKGQTSRKKVVRIDGG